MRVLPVACLKDNYAYLVVCEETNDAAIVDPSEAEPVARAVRDAGVKLRAVWSTHHHWDHVGGNEAIVRDFGVEAVYGHASETARIPGLSRPLETGERFALGSLAVRVMHVPGHTTGALAYVVGDDEAVFTGDTLFVAGCGRLFEGTPAMMHQSLSALAALPAKTKVYCGHEYTESNLRFAAHVEPSNEAVKRAQADAAAARGRGEPTVPGTVGRERETNPFLRATSAEMRKTLGVAADADDVTAFAAIRAAKDNFR
jgi:hydroxyacylglutathione hydrolase